MICGIYAIKNLNNGKIYIGSSRDCVRRFGHGPVMTYVKDWLSSQSVS